MLASIKLWYIQKDEYWKSEIKSPEDTKVLAAAI